MAVVIVVITVVMTGLIDIVFAVVMAGRIDIAVAVGAVDVARPVLVAAAVMAERVEVAVGRRREPQHDEPRHQQRGNRRRAHPSRNPKHDYLLRDRGVWLPIA